MPSGRPDEQKFDPNQLILLEEPEAKKAEAPVPETPPETGAGKSPSKPRSKPSRPRIPEHLPVDEEVIDPDEVKACPQNWRYIGEEVTERLDYRPARFSKQRQIRRKFVAVDAPFSPPIIAPSPPCLQERCLATPNLIAQVVVSKYIDHLPLYRQEQMYRSRHGVEIARQTLCRWVELAAWWFKPIYQEMVRLQNSRAYLQIDETPIRYLQPGEGKCGQGYFWVTSVPGGDAIYHWHPGRGAKHLNQILDQSFSGSLQCDAYKAYTSFQKQRAGPIQLAGCWAHVRRRFYEALELAPTIAGWILRQIGQLYLIERRLREECAGPALRAAVRQSESAPIVRRVKKALMVLKPRYLPQNKMGKAINYALNNWTDLEVFLFNGMIEIDNNLVENAIRPTKLGAKNWLFIGSEGSGKTAAILFTLIESAKRHGLEPSGYLSELLHRLPKAKSIEIARLTPEAMAKGKAKAAA
ncbi:MAG: IS66 family transposase [Opitutales bacterium]|nr:IS66 family transposase [Opitutales bacterium]